MIGKSGSPAPHASPRRWFVNSFAALLVVLTLVWLGSRADDITRGYQFTGRITEYYNLLVDGFLKGQLYMDVEVRSSPSDEPLYLLDANLYNDRYYLYYGVVPAVLVMLPYKLVTGHHISTNAVVVLCLVVGFGFALATFDAVRRRHFPTLPATLHFLLVLFLGFASAIPFLAVRGVFYELPIAAGYACCMAALWCVWRILQGSSRPTLLLAGSSFFLSLAVGCRPNYLFALPALLIPAWLVWQELRQKLLLKQAVLRVVVCLLVPSVLIGGLLAWYNHARFGSPLEFGFKYGINSFFTSGNPLASWRFVWPNLKWYYFSPPSLSPFFPFFYPLAGSFRPAGYHGDEAMHGQLAVTLFGLLLVVCIAINARTRRALRPLAPWLAVLAWIWAVSLVFMVFLTIRGNRYMVDFHAALVLGLACATGVVLTQYRRGRRPVSLLLGLAAALAALTSLGGSLQQFDDLRNGRPQTFKRLARIFNYPSHWAHQLGLFTYGPVAFKVTFPEVEATRFEPLFVAGTPYYSDGLFVAVHPGNHVQFMLDHHGYGGPMSELRSYEPGRLYRVELLMGSLLPPEAHPYFERTHPLTVSAMKLAAKVTLDGELLINGKMNAYDAPPWSHQYGENRATLKPFDTTFSGEVTRLDRPPLRAVGAAADERASGIWLLSIKFGRRPPSTREPVLAAGETGGGVLLLVEWLPDGHIRFALDDWGHGLYHSEPLAVDPDAVYDLNLFLGPLTAKRSWPAEWKIPPAALEPQRNQLHVWLGDQRVWSVPVTHHHDRLHQVKLGANEQGFSTANTLYTSELHPRPFLSSEERQFLQLNVGAAGAGKP